MDEGEVTTVISKGGVVCAWLGWWINLVGDGIRVRAGVDLSGEGAGVEWIDFWDGFWVWVFPKSCSWSWGGLGVVF